MAARVNILLSDFADLVAELSRLRHLPPSSAASSSAVPRYRHDTGKRNTFDELAVGGRFG